MSGPGARGDELDAFARVLRACGIVRIVDAHTALTTRGRIPIDPPLAPELADALVERGPLVLEPLTLTECAVVLGETKARIAAVERAALAKLRLARNSAETPLWSTENSIEINDL